MKNRISVRYILACVTLSITPVFFSGLSAGVQIYSDKAEVTHSINQDEIDGFVGDWQLEQSSVELVIESLNPNGKSQVSILSDNDISVKKVTISRFVGNTPLLTLDTQRDGKPHGVFCLMQEGNKLVGTYDDISSGASADVTFTLKKSIKVSVN